MRSSSAYSSSRVARSAGIGGDPRSRSRSEVTSAFSQELAHLQQALAEERELRRVHVFRLRRLDELRLGQAHEAASFFLTAVAVFEAMRRSHPSSQRALFAAVFVTACSWRADAHG